MLRVFLLWVFLELCPADLSVSLVASYSFENSLSDSSWNGNDAQAVEGTLNFVTGRIGNAIHCDHQFVGAAPTNNFPVGSSPRTLSTWVLIDQSFCPDEDFIAGYGFATSPSWGDAYCLLNTCNQGFMFSQWGGMIHTPTAITLGIWYHLAVTSDLQGNTTLFVDGVPIVWGLFAGPALNTVPNTLLYMCKLQGSIGSTRAIGAGAIDELHVWSRSLTPNEVLELYQAESANIQLVGKKLSSTGTLSSPQTFPSSAGSGATSLSSSSNNINISPSSSVQLPWSTRLTSFISSSESSSFPPTIPTETSITPTTTATGSCELPTELVACQPEKDCLVSCADSHSSETGECLVELCWGYCQTIACPVDAELYCCAYGRSNLEDTVVECAKRGSCGEWSPDSGLLAWQIGAIAGASGFLFLVVVILVVCCLKGKKPNGRQITGKPPTTKSQQHSASSSSSSATPSSSAYTGTYLPPTPQVGPPIAMYPSTQNGYQDVLL